MPRLPVRRARGDAFTRVEVFLARLKFLIFEIVMLVCFLLVLYKVLGHELRF